MSRLYASRRGERGVTLIELIVTITVLALAGVALMGTMGYLAGESGDAIAETQAQAVADKYLASTLAQSFPSIAGGTAAQGSMQVTIAVSSSGALTGVPSTAAKRVDVTVMTPNGQTVIATGYRLAYP
jgi:prepilin-type N-terminal cleavage/methylation domain-containing protein